MRRPFSLRYFAPWSATIGWADGRRARSSSARRRRPAPRHVAARQSAAHPDRRRRAGDQRCARLRAAARRSASDCVGLGRDALATLCANGHALVILDVGLPDLSGFDVYRELRRASDVPVLFLTARADEIDRIVGPELGADDYVAKPFSPREVAGRGRR